MALRDWLNPDYDPLATEKPAICSKSELKIARIARLAPEIANPAILQSIDSKDELSRNSKNSRNSNSNAPELKKQGMKRLEAAAAGLPVTVEELAAFFGDDLQSFGTGEVKQAGIVTAVRWFAFQHLGRVQPQTEEIPAGMVRCTDCLQDRCKHRQVTPWGR
ncbi:hypothetical protein HMY34_01925 [Thiothrix subterranea]|uniref:hypothetical protein n=1 Tax=Thiothrix subterranea TaxID=2735563 RepID=UPI00192C76F9|nr:hypothetical protein [Thiothrix subterranea]QQZ27607.1 hypothetical protein HMY34_01925 [Thiothrix subterranea]